VPGEGGAATVKLLVMALPPARLGIASVNKFGPAADVADVFIRTTAVDGSAPPNPTFATVNDTVTGPPGAVVVGVKRASSGTRSGPDVGGDGGGSGAGGCAGGGEGGGRGNGFPSRGI